MSLCVVNYPTIGTKDFDWIQSVRSRHDPLFFKVVAPHITLVFPTDAVDESILVSHVKEKASGVSSFDLVFRCAIVGDPSFMDHAHAFLIPDEGFSDIVRLHDRLYTGPLASELRLDLPFIPHIGIANTRELSECKTIVDQLNQEIVEIRGTVDVLDIIGYDGEAVWTIEQCPLAGGAASSTAASRDG